MNARALTVAANLVESGIYLRAPGDHGCIDRWIAEVASDSPEFAATKTALDSLTDREDLRTAALKMAAAYARAAYQLGIHVGLQVRPSGEVRHP